MMGKSRKKWRNRHNKPVKKEGVGLGIREEILSKYPYERKYTPLIFH
jgi:hypothetical protein